MSENPFVSTQTAPVRPRYLLLQARPPNDLMRGHEHGCFVEQMGIALDDLEVHDVVESVPSLTHLERYRGILIGGSGDHYVSKRDLPTLDWLLELLFECVARGIPTFGVCYGFHLLVAALGGEVVHDPDSREVGTHAVELTEAGRADELLGTLPARFLAQMGHKDRALHYAGEIPNLASSERCPLQALRVPDKPIWGVQFHPELSCEANRDRFEYFVEGYARDLSDQERRETSESFRESVEASSLLRTFVALL